ncbi:MAG: thermopsin [Thermoplasmata archaeon]|nr:thermopsin [Thermoplasmata archaeon]
MTYVPASSKSAVGTLAVLALLAGSAFASSSFLPVHAPSPIPPAPSAAPVSISVAGHASARTVASQSVLLRRGPGPAGSGIHPLQFGLTEPIAMGIGDFGITPDMVPYEYSSPVFRAELTVNSLNEGVLYTCNSSECYYPEVSVQLNLNLVLINGSRTMEFWVQNVPFLDTQDTNSQYLEMDDNVWNYSSSSTIAMPDSTIVGNGSVQGHTYYAYAAPAGLPGNDVDLSDPATIQAQSVSATANGVPYVLMQYNDGYGWWTYDNITFPWAHGWTDDNFVVDGYQTAPIGDPIDADWTIDGPGGGTTGTDIASSANLSLEYWNGHNFQAVTNAFNFGITGESAENVISQAALNATGGIPAASYTAGNGTPEALYGPGQVGLLNVTSAVPDGTLFVNGTPTPFVGGQVNLTLAAGTYLVQLDGPNSSWQGEANITLSPGEYLPLNLGWRSVWFNESGLPAGTNWTLTVDGVNYSTTNGSIEVFLPQGEFAYSVGYQAGFTPRNASGSLAVGPAGASLTIQWIPVPYGVRVETQGLPAGIGWSISVGDIVYRSSTNASIPISLPNGSYAYQLSVDSYAYFSTAPFGNFTVIGGPLTVTAAFAPRYAVLSGTVDPANATVSVNGMLVPLVQGGFLVQLVAGVYWLNASEVGYTSSSGLVTLTPANITPESINLLAEVSNPPPPPGGHGSTSAAGSGATPAELAAIGIAVVALVGVATLVVWRRRPSRP